ncbi:hypothetical protein [Chryseobacterium jejuense]|uniref:hypothetical protein n=1 Tax=Chryseobacterium jejuense TaxID=445960 RepID=UPI001AEB8BB1|nr:hypothetical protein [Chryseobacterium jejuense]MBP2616581.1 hypothetical protein [Chryseobacterium jejuense]
MKKIWELEGWKSEDGGWRMEVTAQHALIFSLQYNLANKIKKQNQPLTVLQ